MTARSACGCGWDDGGAGFRDAKRRCLVVPSALPPPWDARCGSGRLVGAAPLLPPPRRRRRGPFAGLRTVMRACGMRARRRAAGTVLALRGRGVAAARRAAVFARQRDADQPFDVAQIRHLLGARDQRDRDALGAGARGAADAVDIGLGHVRQVEIDDMADAVDVDAAGGDVGGDQGADFAGAERGERALAVVLRLVAVDGVGGDAGPGEALHHLVGAVLGAGEDQRAVDRLLLQELRQQRGLRRVIDLDDALGDALDGRGDRRHRDPRGIAQHRFRELGDVLRHGGREEQRLPLDRQLGDDFADVVDEAHVQHAVGLVEHEVFDLAELEAVALHEVEQAAGGGDQHFDAAHQAADLAAHRHAADGERRGEPHVAAIGVEAVEDLPGQLAGRAQHQHAAALRLHLDAVLQQAVQDRQREGRGLAGAGLGDADHVAPGERERDGLGLDGGGGEVVFFTKRSRDQVGEAEILEGGQKGGVFHKAAGAPAIDARRGVSIRSTRVFGEPVC